MYGSGNCIQSLFHVEALSDVALSVLAEEEMNTPVSERSVNCFGSTILTNIGHRGCSEGERGRKHPASSE